MLEALTASRSPAHIGTHPYVLSLSFHSLVVAAAIALTRHTGTATHSRVPEPGILFVAPQPMRSLPPAAARPDRPSQTWPTLPTLPLNIEAPDLGPPVLSPTVPTVADLLNDANIKSGVAPGLPAGGLTSANLSAAAPFTAAAVDDPVGVIEQPVPRYPSVLAQAGITGRVELTYVVDTMGRAEPGSLHTLMSTHPAFDAAARASVLATRYKPARLHGRTVRQLVRQTLSFRLAD
jgi:TonB family protein